MGRNEQLTTYVDAKVAREIERRAEAEDVSASTYIAQVLDQHIHGEAVEEQAREHRAEQRIQELIAEARDEVSDATEGLEDLVAKSGVYSIAVWELVKDEYDDPRRQHALDVGTERLRENMDALEGDIESARTQSTTSSETTDSAAAESDDRDWDFE